MIKSFRWPLRWWLVAFLFTVTILSFVGSFIGTVIINDWDSPLWAQPLEYSLEAAGEWERWEDATWQMEFTRDLHAVGIDVALFDASGELVYESQPAPSPGRPRHVNRGGAGSNRRWLEERQVFHDGVLIGTVRVGFNWNPIIDDRALDWQMLWMSLIVVLGSAVLTSVFGIWILNRVFLTPLRHLAAAADDVLRGNLDVALPAAKVSEVQGVLDGFRHMARGLRESIRRQAAVEEERRFFLAAISHDLRTPLFSLRGRLEGIRDGVATTPEKIEHYLKAALRQVAGLEKLVSDLFAYSRTDILEQAPQKEPLDPVEFLKGAIESMHAAARSKDVALTLSAPDLPCSLHADGDLLNRAVENLLSNAIRHTPPGGSVEIGCHIRGKSVELWVADTGEGVPATVLNRLLDPKRTYDALDYRQSGGLGLGLAIVRRIAEVHGGMVAAQNRAQGGACFLIRLPLSEVGD